MYQKRQYNKGGDSQEEECEESDKEDWRMQVKDEDVCDGIEDISRDNEDKPLRNKQRITL